MTQPPYGKLAELYCDSTLPLQVLRSSAGFYIGTLDDCGPVSRESAQYWKHREEAEQALATGDWEQHVL